MSNPFNSTENKDNLIFHPIDVCLATATHNFKWVKISLIC